jgi:proteasome lid subunit RPN8/RPN11
MKKGSYPFSVTMDRATLSDLLQHAREELPNECCGLLIGRRGAVTGSARARNLQASPMRYLVDPADHFAAMRAARSQGLHVVGAYHSHPASDPVPSASDVAEATGGRDFLYVIVSPAGDEVRAYYLISGDVKLVDLAFT